jgi:hypothetical protein
MIGIEFYQISVVISSWLHMILAYWTMANSDKLHFGASFDNGIHDHLSAESNAAKATWTTEKENVNRDGSREKRY